MKGKYSFHPDAIAEFTHAVEYYDTCSEALGLDFATEVHATIERILTHPYAWTEMETDIRRCLVSRFPFGILYTIEDDHIFVLAVMHLHREPNYWKYRT